jgi:hypothetical protein
MFSLSLSLSLSISLLQGKIDLSNVFDIVEDTTITTQFQITISESKRIYYLQADTPQERDFWVTSLRELISDHFFSYTAVKPTLTWSKEEIEEYVRR